MGGINIYLLWKTMKLHFMYTRGYVFFAQLCFIKIDFEKFDMP